MATLYKFAPKSPTQEFKFTVKDGKPHIDGDLGWQDVLAEPLLFNFKYPLPDTDPAAKFCDELLAAQGLGHKRY